MYCVYLTVYSGNKLPPFYIGYCRKDKIDKGYLGTPTSKEYKEIFKEEKENSIHLFKIHIIKEYKTAKEAKLKETDLQTKLQVLKNPLYFNRSINSKEFLNSAPHKEETKKKIGDANRGKKHNQEFRNIVSDRMKNHLVVMNNDGLRMWMSKDDPRYISGEFYSIRKGYVHKSTTRKKMSENHVTKQGKKMCWDSTTGKTLYLKEEEIHKFGATRVAPDRLREGGRKAGLKIFVIDKQTGKNIRINREDFNPDIYTRGKNKTGGFVGWDKINSEYCYIVDIILKTCRHIKKKQILKNYTIMNMLAEYIIQKIRI